ncbi:MAG: hypothetical protein HQL89_05665 [Magnetococcales bacterium]|nr:hypothetical protein [Magnetococcales bacterium]
MSDNFSATSYSRNNLFQVIAKHTNRSLHEVQKKRQIKYLAKLLEQIALFRFPEAQRKMTILVEHNYVHRATLHDYSEFNVFSFFDYSRHCVRLNFFHGDHSEQDLTETIHGMTNNAMKKITSLKERFIGSMILRKNQGSFLAQVNLPHPFPLDDHSISLPFLRQYSMGIFGIPVETNDCVAWVEQDRIVSVCASSALFIMLHALRLDLFNPGFPSPAKITRIAVKGHSASSPVFPNRGLTPEMMARVIQAQGMEPFHVNLGFKEDDDVDEMASHQRLLRTIHAYTRMNVAAPIMGMRTMKYLEDVGENHGNLKRSNKSTECLKITEETKIYTRSDGHAVTILGYGPWHSTPGHPVNLQEFFSSSRRRSDAPPAGYDSAADNISFIVIHDDQTGPFVRCVVKKDEAGFLLSETPAICQFLSENISKSVFHYHLVNVLDPEKKIPHECNEEEEKNLRSAPELLLMGLHPKIRLHLQSIETLVVQFETMLSKLVFETYLKNNDLGNDLLEVLHLGDTKSIANNKPNRVIRYLWDIYLDRNTEMKFDLRKQFHAGDRPVNEDGMKILEQRWPLFVWRASAWDATGRVFDIFFDATDTLSDNVVIQIVIYRNEIDSFVRKIFHMIIGTTDNEMFYLWNESIIFLHWMKQGNLKGSEGNNEMALSDKFGHLHLPSYLNPWELSDDGRCKPFNDDERLIFDDKITSEWTKSGKKLNIWLKDNNHSVTLIWIIDGHGRLIIGKERPVDQQHPKKMLGHPALVAGGQARIAGEMKWDNQRKHVEINNHSGRYTKRSVDRKKSHLDNVVLWMNQISKQSRLKKKFYGNYNPEYGADLINSIFDLKKEIKEILSMPNLNLRRAGEELGRKLTSSAAMMKEENINDALILADEWDGTDATQVRIIFCHGLAPWLEQLLPQNFPETIVQQIHSFLSKWFNADHDALRNAILEVFVIIHSNLHHSSQMILNTFENYTNKYSYLTDGQNQTLKLIREFLTRAKAQQDP